MAHGTPTRVYTGTAAPGAVAYDMLALSAMVSVVAAATRGPADPSLLGVVPKLAEAYVLRRNLLLITDRFWIGILYGFDRCSRGF
jgi:hypothetical protein